jgi:hypothetical protein
MKRAIIAAGMLLGAASTLTFAQAADVPKHKCEPKPTLPGSRLMEEPSVRKRFQSDLDAYKKCMTTYLDDRKAAIAKEQEAANAAIEEYNKTMKDLADQQKNQ